MFFSLDVMRARKGDCLMLHYGKPNDPRLVMIDGGPRKVYGSFLKPRITEIRKARKIKAQDPLMVDLLMVSHVDDDHIQGILDLTHELITAQDDHKPALVQVLSFWHNSFENIIGDTPEDLTNAMRTTFGAASLGGEPPGDLSLDPLRPIEEETVVSTLKVLASIEQGARLRSDANRLQFPLNPEFDGGLIMARKAHESIQIVDDLRFTVAGPMLPELKSLHAKHQAWLRELQKRGTSPEEVLAAYVDRSVPNLSSVVVLAEADGASMLLTGDARGDKILEGLEFIGRLRRGGQMQVDVLKVPHHGSSNNLDNDFFERIRASHYVFSGDGEHGNPERASLEMLLRARGDEPYTIHFTYPIEEIDIARREDWEKEQNKEKQRREKNSNQQVRPDWSPEEHGLAEFFKQNDGIANRIRVVQPGSPHVIDLRDKLPF